MKMESGKRMDNEKEVTEDQSLVWWDKEWAEKDKTRRNQGESMPAGDTIGWINKTLEKGIETRIWYLKTDVIMRVLSIVVQDEEWEDLMRLGKRIGIIKKELGDIQGSQIIKEAVREAEFELAKHGMTNDNIKEKLEYLINKTGETSVF
jgi:hypothetical protein